MMARSFDDKGINAMLWTFVIGGWLALVVLVWRIGAALRLAGRLWRQAAALLHLPWWRPLTEAERAELHQPLFLAPGRWPPS